MNFKLNAKTTTPKGNRPKRARIHQRQQKREQRYAHSTMITKWSQSTISMLGYHVYVYTTSILKAHPKWPSLGFTCLFEVCRWRSSLHHITTKTPVFTFLQLPQTISTMINLKILKASLLGKSTLRMPHCWASQS